MKSHRKFSLLLLLLSSIAQAQCWFKPIQGDGFWVDHVTSLIGDSVIFTQRGMLDCYPKSQLILIDVAGVGVKVMNRQYLNPISPEDIHGFVMDKGNCVYVPISAHEDYDIIGERLLREDLQQDGFWKLVDSPEEAHFILDYYADLSGRDKAIFTVTERKNNTKTILVPSKDREYLVILTGEEEDDIREAIQKFMNRYVWPLQKKIISGKLKKSKKGNLPMDNLFAD